MQDADHTPGYGANCLSNPIRVGLATCPGCWLFLPGPLLHPRRSSSPESGWDAPTTSKLSRSLAEPTSKESLVHSPTGKL